MEQWIKDELNYGDCQMFPKETLLYCFPQSKKKVAKSEEIKRMKEWLMT